MEKEDTAPFLRLVAGELIARFGTDLSEVTVVFPNRRARLFFNNYLYEYAGTPVWAPQYLSIDELFEQASPLRKADSIQLICELYRTYQDIQNTHSQTPSNETLDEFFFFGEMLLNDFDDVDKYVVNARSLFSNLQELDQLRDDFSHLNESQIETLIRYFKHTFQEGSPLKNAFWSIWRILGEVYFSFKERLEKKGIAYPGMLMRSVIETEEAVFPYKQVVFAGFNVLNKCEEKLFKKLRDKSLFFWDFDSYYLNPTSDSAHEAGRFVAENIRQFGSALDLNLFNHFLAKEKEITIMVSPSESGQSAVIPLWIDSLRQPSSFTKPESAIVLCNEAILPAVMHSIPPEKVENVNITMGFPMMQSPVCSFLQVWTEMQTKGYVSSSKAFRHPYVLSVLRHPYTRILFPKACEVEKTITRDNLFFPTYEVLSDATIFSYAKETLDLARNLLLLIEKLGHSLENETTTSDTYAGLYKESVFRAYQVVNRLYGFISTGELNVEKITFLRLLKKLFSTTQIPFHGEPVKGLQVMGVLETRSLDFKHLLMLSTNEGFMPGGDNDNTFIPQFLRKHFGLSTVDHRDSVYAYYFYRLIQRAEKITFVFSADKTQTGKAEMSRFLLQLLLDPRLKIRRFSLQSFIKPLQAEPIEILKDDRMLERIKNKYDFLTNSEARTLSPSALNVFIDCSFRFYLQYIEELRTQEELTDELDSSVFGTIFHRSAEYLYREIGPIGNQQDSRPFEVKKEHFDPYLRYPHLIEKLVVRAFDKDYFKGKNVSTKLYNGEQLINFRVICHMVRRLIEFDRTQAPFFIHGIEQVVEGRLVLEEKKAVIKIRGIIDRLEEKDGSIRVLDYKTSGTAKSFKRMEDLVIQKDTRASHVFQLFIYASLLVEKMPSGQPIVPALLYLQDAGKENFSPMINYEKEEITDFNKLSPSFKEIIEAKVSELFDPAIPFQQTTALSKCSYCDFKELCSR